MFFKDFVSVKRQKIKRGASQTYDTPSSELQFAYVRIQQCTCLYILFHSYLCPAIKTIMLKISTFLRDIPILFHKNGGISFVFCNFALEKGKVAAGGCSLVII